MRQGLLPALVPDDFEARTSFIEDGKEIALPDDMAPFTHGHDILGDGALIAIPLLDMRPVSLAY